MLTDQPKKPQPGCDSAESLDRPRGPHVVDGKHEPHRLYEVISKDGEIVERTAREIAEGSTHLSNLKLFVANLNATVERVRLWCEERRSSLLAVLVEIRSTKVLLYVVPVADRYDLELGTAMTQLEVELSCNGIGYVESLQVPMRSLRRFAGTKSLIAWLQNDNALVESQSESVTHIES